MESVISVVAVILCVILYGVHLYESTKGDLLAVVTEMIAQAEMVQQCTGSQKMEFVVSRLRERVPTILQSYFTVERLEALAQKVFDSMHAYAKAREK